MARENNVSVILTLVAFDHIIRQAESLPALLALPEYKFLAPWVRAGWQPGKNLYEKKFANAESLAYLKKSIALQKKLAQAFRQAGVSVLVGTDAMNMGVVPGFSVHEELRNLVEIGFTPFEALQAATVRPAEFLRKNEFGTIAVGKRADLILVAGDPLKDVSNASKLSGVMTRGRWLSKNELSKMLNEVPARYTDEEQLVKTNFGKNAGRVQQYLSENDPFDNLLNEAITNLVAEKGVGEFIKFLGETKKANQSASFVQEDFINALGYRLLGQNKMKEAIEIFKFNVETYPKSANTYDSLAETYLAAGEKELALKFYKKALEVDAGYPNAKVAAETVKKLEAELLKK
jgi:tetratricopeptide (TPR) repeat protein